MKLPNYLLLLPLVFAGCAYEEPVATTTTVTREVTTTGPVGREIIATSPPPTARVEVQTVAPGPGYGWT
ncbi:MAG: hypothetical protein ABR514_09770, partial [Chthoniobacterales bacterium]